MTSFNKTKYEKAVREDQRTEKQCEVKEELSARPIELNGSDGGGGIPQDWDFTICDQEAAWYACD